MFSIFFCSLNQLNQNSMKLFQYPVYFLLFSVAIMTGCESRTQQLKSQSPDGKAEIIINGNKDGMDPWQLSLELIKEGKSTPAGQIQMYAGELTNENVIFTWETNKKCNLKLIEQDGATREFPIEF